MIRLSDILSVCGISLGMYVTAETVMDSLFPSGRLHYKGPVSNIGHQATGRGDADGNKSVDVAKIENGR